MSHLTLNQAKQHLAGLRKLAVEENRYLPCVVNYLRYVDVDVCTKVRADTITSYQDIMSLDNDVDTTQKIINSFLMG